MKLIARADIRNEDVRCRYGDVIEVSDGVAEEYLRRGLATPIPTPKAEVAASSGAPQNAVSRRRGAKLQPAAGGHPPAPGQEQRTGTGADPEPEQ